MLLVTWVVILKNLEKYGGIKMNFDLIKKTILSLKNVYCVEDIIDFITDLYQSHIITLKERNILINMLW